MKLAHSAPLTGGKKANHAKTQILFLTLIYYFERLGVLPFLDFWTVVVNWLIFAFFFSFLSVKKNCLHMLKVKKMSKNTNVCDDVMCTAHYDRILAYDTGCTSHYNTILAYDKKVYSPLRYIYSVRYNLSSPQGYLFSVRYSV